MQVGAAEGGDRLRSLLRVLQDAPALQPRHHLPRAHDVPPRRVLAAPAAAAGAARPIEDKIREFGKMPDVRLTPEEIESIRQIGDNTGCMKLKGASKRHATSERCDEWPMKPELLELAQREGLGTEW